jgi:NOL1/NOP2/fmu family ribosome biogenesis protein
MYKVNNLTATYANYKYVVIRDCTDITEGFWYYGAYNDIVAAQFDEGINVVGYKGVPIGFVKRIGARCNNMYPKDLRIVKL